MLRETETKYGRVRGIEAADPRITAYKGIPFAAPPVGDLRWRAPRPPKAWEGVRECYRFAPISIQDTPGLGTDLYCREWHVDPGIEMSEDCLYLNVWTPAKTKDEKLPVVVWFFGGALQWGYPSEMEFDGERVARRGIVFVSVNYRVAAMGFLTHPDLVKSQRDECANFGLFDQHAGLKWVHENIAAFGGDPDNVTIAGQSAGGGSVMGQIAYPANKGLFNKAIIQSGVVRFFNGESPFKPLPMEEAVKKGERFFEILGVKTVEEARKLDAMYIRDKYTEYSGSDFSPAGMLKRMMTAVDDRICFGDPYDDMVSGNCNNVPIMAGNTSDEFAGLSGNKTNEMSYRTAAGTDKTISLIDGGNPSEGAIKVMALLRNDNGIDKPIYYYRLDTDIPGDDHPGNFHSVDLWFFLETLAKCSRPFVGRHYDLARLMCNYWCNFVKSGDPNGSDSDGSQMPEWLPYDEKHMCSMIFGTDGPKPVNAG